jgi:spermidine synthase
MLSGFSLAPKLVEKDNIRILVLGTGAGLLPMFLKGQLGERLKELVTVDINEEIVKVAKEYFGFVTDDKLKSVIADAYEYVNNYNSAKFDVIIMDINYEESELNLSPPLKFMDAGFLRKLLVNYFNFLIIIFRI